MLKWSTVSKQRSTKEEFWKKQLRKPHSTVRNGRVRRFVLVPCTEIQPATASLFPTTVAESRTETDTIWYMNSPRGVNTLSTTMKEISLGAGLATVSDVHYYSVRATSITLWSIANVPSRHIMSISGHANEQSISSYISRPSLKQLKNCSNILKCSS